MPKGIYARKPTGTKFTERIVRRAIQLYDETGMRMGRISEALAIPTDSINRMLRGEKYPHLKSRLFIDGRLRQGHWKTTDRRMDLW